MYASQGKVLIPFSFLIPIDDKAVSVKREGRRRGREEGTWHVLVVTTLHFLLLFPSVAVT